jgi:small conductance mechanosensitive channel
MRGGFVSFFMFLALSLAMPGEAGAQAVAAHPASTAAPAKPAVSTIIPGSPLAALTGAATTPASAAATPPSPFGTEALGLSVTRFITTETTDTVVDFAHAIKKSTTLTPVWQWLQGFGSDPVRRSDAGQIAIGLAITLLPALAADALIRLGLTRPRVSLIARARAWQPAETPAPANPGIEAAEAGEIELRPRRRETLLAWARRLLLSILLLLLNLAPIIGFGVAVGLLLSAGFITSRDARLSIIGVANAYLVCRIALVISWFFTAPWAPPLRLLALADAHALKFNKWLLILLATGGFSYAIVSIAEILELPAEGARAIILLLVLAIHVELALMIWLSRKVVAGWIRGKQDPNDVFAPWRRRLAAGWHYPALFYILALWVAYAGGVHNAFGVLLRVVLYFMAAIILGRLGWSGSDHGLDRLFPDPKARDVRHPNFVSRARNYNPLIRSVIRIVIVIGVLAIMLLGWGVNLLPWLLKNRISHGLIIAFAWIIVIVAIALVIWEIANGWLDGRTEKLAKAGKTRQARRLRTLAPILKATFGTMIGLVAGLLCLSRIGVNAAPLLAGAGVLGIAIGFGSQKLVQDIITGLFLLLEDTMQVGDVVTLAGMSGTVERLTIRTISLRGADGSVNIIPFSAVTTVTNQTRDFGIAQITVGVAYEENVDHVCAVLTDIARTMRAEPAWGSMMRDDLQINGLDQLGASALTITGQIRTGPGQHWAVRREFNRRMVARFAAEHIEIPYTYLPPAPPFTEPAKPPAEAPQAAPAEANAAAVPAGKA